MSVRRPKGTSELKQEVVVRVLRNGRSGNVPEDGAR